MRETGNDASYSEGWKRLEGTGDGPFFALELMEDNGVPRKGFWVRAGDRFTSAVGRPLNEEAVSILEEVVSILNCEPGSHTIAEKVGKSLAEATDDQEPASALRQAWSYVAAMGKIRDDGAWDIESSTRPDLVGCTLVDTSDSALVLSRWGRCCSILLNHGPMEHEPSSRIIDNDGACQYAIQYIMDRKENETTITTKSKRLWRVVEVRGCELPFED